MLWKFISLNSIIYLIVSFFDLNKISADISCATNNKCSKIESCKRIRFLCECKDENSIEMERVINGFVVKKNDLKFIGSLYTRSIKIKASVQKPDRNFEPNDYTYSMIFLRIQFFSILI